MVGVVSEVKYAGLEQPDQGTVYSPMRDGLSRTVILRAHGDPSSVMPVVREAIRGVDANVPLTTGIVIRRPEL